MKRTMRASGERSRRRLAGRAILIALLVLAAIPLVALSDTAPDEVEQNRKLFPRGRR